MPQLYIRHLYIRHQLDSPFSASIPQFARLFGWTHAFGEQSGGSQPPLVSGTPNRAKPCWKVRSGVGSLPILLPAPARQPLERTL